MHQYIDIPQQIQLLKSRGLTIHDNAKAAEILSDIGFYRLGFYFFPLEKSYPALDNRTHQYIPGASFEDGVQLYYFDYDLRRLLLNALTRIENNIRTHILDHVSLAYRTSATWFVDSNVMAQSFIASFDTKVYNAMKENPAIKRHHQHHLNHRYAPAWKTMEFMTMGNLCSLYHNVKSEMLKKEIAADYGCSIGVFVNYIENLRVIRNKCAHGGCLYNIKLALGVKTRPANIPSAARQYIAGEIGVIDFMLGKISVNRQKEFRNALNTLLNEPRNPKTTQIIADCTKIFLLPFVIP